MLYQYIRRFIRFNIDALKRFRPYYLANIHGPALARSLHWQVLFMALLCASGWLLLFPGSSEAHAATLMSSNLTQSTSLASSPLDGPGVFRFLMSSLVALGVTFWVAAQLWHAFVLQLFDGDGTPRRTIDELAEQRFLRRFSIPTLFLILLANLGLLLSEGATLTTGPQAPYWLLREFIALLALGLSIVLLRLRSRSQVVDELLAWARLLLALGMLIAMALSSHAASTASNIVVYAVAIDWLHLLAAALWIGGMFYLSLVYLPVLSSLSTTERMQALLSILPHFSILAIAGVILMATTGPLNAVIHISSFEQVLTTAYGRALLVKIILVGTLLLISAFHVFILRPQLARTYKRLTSQEQVQSDQSSEDEAEPGARTATPELKQLETSVETQYHRLTRILRWEPLFGVAVLLCASLLGVFAGTLQPTSTTQQTPPSSASPAAKPFEASTKTEDGTFTVKIQVTPNHFGNNTIIVHVLDNNGTPVTDGDVSVALTMLDMDMGTNTVDLQLDDKGQFTGEGIFSMGGHWQLRILLHSSQNTTHEATVTDTVPF